MSDLPQPSEKFETPVPDNVRNDLLQPWLKQTQVTESTGTLIKADSCPQAAIQFFADFDVKQPKPPGDNANDQDWNAYNKGVGEWRQQWNEHVEKSDKMIRYDKLDGKEQKDFKDWLENVVSPKDSDKPNLLKGDDNAQALEKELRSTADAQKWLDAIKTLEEYKQKCSAQ